MVRTHAHASQLDAGRILAYATVFALHLAVLLLLLVPATMPPPDAAAQDSPERVIWQAWSPPRAPPLPPAPVHPAKQLPKPQTQPHAVAQAPVVDAAANDNNEPAEQTAATSDTVPATATPAGDPASIGQLAYVEAAPPPYPRAELDQGIGGTVVLKVLVGIDGVPVQVDVQQSSGHRNLDRAAAQHVLKHWRFQPALRDGQPVQAYGLVPIAFSVQ